MPHERGCDVHGVPTETQRRRRPSRTGRSGKSQSPTSRGTPDGPAGLLARMSTTLLAVRSIESRIAVQSCPDDREPLRIGALCWEGAGGSGRVRAGERVVGGGRV